MAAVSESLTDVKDEVCQAEVRAGDTPGSDEG